MPAENFLVPSRECGRIHETLRNATEISFVWSIPKIFSWKKPGRVLKSPVVEWLGDSWHLQILPSGEKRFESLANAWVGLSLLCSPGRRRQSTRVRFTFGVQKVDGTEEVILRDHRFADRSHSWHTRHFLRRYELLKLRHQLISWGTLNVTCTIRIDERALAGNRLTNLGIIGDVRETFRKSDGVCLEWRIPPILLSSVVGDYYSSPNFFFLNTFWNLRIYPSGYPGKLSEWIGLMVNKSHLGNSWETVYVMLGIEMASSKEKVWFRNVLLTENDPIMTFCEILPMSKLPKPTLIMDPSNALIVTCTLRTGKITRERVLSEDYDKVLGDIRETFRRCNEIHLEWRIPQFSSLSEELTRFSSPVLEFLNASWQLRIYPNGCYPDECPRWVGLQLRKLDWSNFENPVFLTFGIKRVDSTEEMIFPNEILPGFDYIWFADKFLCRCELPRRRYHIVPSDVLTITCTISTEAASSMSGENFKSFADATLRERECNSHKEVEWDVHLSSREKTSPVFVIGSQRYWLKLESCVFDKERMELILFSLGPPNGLSQSARWWAGLKRPDGAYLFSNTSGVLNLENNRGTWMQRSLYTVREEDVIAELPELEYSRLKLTIFLRMSVERTTRVEEVCSHGAAEMFDTESHGSIREVDCAFHKQVEWDIVISSPSQRTSDKPVPRKLISHEFSVETVKFKLECSMGLFFTDFALNLYSQCPNALPFPSGRWWVTLMRSDGISFIKNLRGELGLTDECELWTQRGSLKFRCNEIWTREFTRRLRVVFRYSREETPVSKACNHGIIEMPLQGIGSIREEEFTSYKQVEWSVHFDLLFKSVVSPEFVMGSQRYVLEFTPQRRDIRWAELYLYRFGPSVTDTSRFVRWCAGFKRGNGTYHCKKRRGKLDLKEECEIWTQIHFLHRMSYEELEKECKTSDFRLSIFLELREDRLSFFKKASNHELDIPLPVSKRRRRQEHSEVIFLVKGVEFKVLRDMLINGGPVLNVMFDHDTVEKKTGIVTIEDCEPAIFEEFLNYITLGFLRELTEHNAIGLFIVADKYMLYDLKLESLQGIHDTISVHNFCDVFTLALIYGEEDLLRYTIDFFSKNDKNIIQTDHWQTFYKNNRAIANKLREELTRYSRQVLARKLFSIFAKRRNQSC